MFNPMSSPEVIRAVGEVLKGAAEQGAEDGYRRAQVLSAYSVTRHLAAEESGRAPLAAWFRGELETILGDRDGGSALAAETEPAALGERLSRLLAELRAADDEDSRRTAAALRSALRQLCDREVETLAGA